MDQMDAVHPDSINENVEVEQYDTCEDYLLVLTIHYPNDSYGSNNANEISGKRWDKGITNTPNLHRAEIDC